MKNFDYDYYSKHPDVKLKTREGYPARIIATDIKRRLDTYLAIAIMVGDREFLQVVNKDGYIDNKDMPNQDDLMIDTINLDKPIITRQGYPVRIICTDAKGDFPIVGLVITEPNREISIMFTADGHHNVNGDHPLDLINVEDNNDIGTTE